MPTSNAVLMDHEHGATNNRCIHPDCQAAYARWSKQYRLDKHRGVERTNDGDLARKHIAMLEGAGWSRRSIAGAAGISAAAISRMAHGQKTVKAEVLRKLQSVDPATLPQRPSHGSTYVFVPRIGTVRRIQALLALGWTHSHIGTAAGVNTRVLLTQQGRWVSRPTHDAIATAYRTLSARPGPSEITRRRAAKLGYLSPAAWADIDIDDAPELDVAGASAVRRANQVASDEVDEVLVQRILDGRPRPRKPTYAENAEAYRRLVARGESAYAIEHTYGLVPSRYKQESVA